MLFYRILRNFINRFNDVMQKTAEHLIQYRCVCVCVYYRRLRFLSHLP